MRGNSVGQAAGAFNSGERGQHFRRNLLVQLDVLIELREQAAAHRLDFIVVAIALRNRHYFRFVVLFHVQDALDTRAMHTLDQHLDRAVRQLEHLQNAGD